MYSFISWLDERVSWCPRSECLCIPPQSHTQRLCGWDESHLSWPSFLESVGCRGREFSQSGHLPPTQNSSGSGEPWLYRVCLGPWPQGPSITDGASTGHLMGGGRAWWNWSKPRDLGPSASEGKRIVRMVTGLGQTLKAFHGQLFIYLGQIGTQQPITSPADGLLFFLKIHTSLKSLWALRHPLAALSGAKGFLWELQALVLPALGWSLGLPSSKPTWIATDVSGLLGHALEFFISRSVSQRHELLKGRLFALFF